MKKTVRPVTPAFLRLRNFFITFSVIAIAAALSIWFLISCRVETVTVETTLFVPQPTILDAANIKTGRHLYGISDAKIEQKITEASPYVKSVTLKRKLPSAIQICVEEYDLAYYIEYAERYYLVTDEFLVIEETTPMDAAEKGAIPLMIPKLKDPKATKEDPDPPKILKSGTMLTFDVKTNKAWSLTLLSMINATDFSEQITAIDLSDAMSLKLNVKGKYEVLLGNEKDFEKKLSRVENTLAYLDTSMQALVGILHAEKDAPITFTFTGVTEEPNT